MSEKDVIYVEERKGIPAVPEKHIGLTHRMLFLDKIAQGVASGELVIEPQHFEIKTKNDSIIRDKDFGVIFEEEVGKKVDSNGRIIWNDENCKVIGRSFFELATNTFEIENETQERKAKRELAEMIQLQIAKDQIDILQPDTQFQIYYANRDIIRHINRNAQWQSPDRKLDMNHCYYVASEEFSRLFEDLTRKTNNEELSTKISKYVSEIHQKVKEREEKGYY